jgi:selenide,water dikinase
LIRPENAVPGDVLVLTKPLGTQVAVNAHQWLHQHATWTNFQASHPHITVAEVMRAYRVSCESMTRLNRNAAALMHTHGAHAATDVTGFGILGHTENLASNQKRHDLVFQLTVLPVIRSMLSVDSEGIFQLAKGKSAGECENGCVFIIFCFHISSLSETSGGLLLAIPADRADAYIADLVARDHQVITLIRSAICSHNRVNLAMLDCW